MTDATDVLSPLDEAGVSALVEEGLAAVGQNLRRMTGELNQRLKTATRGWLDLPSLFSFLFLIRGVQKMLLLKQLPSGPQLLWWAFSLLRGWRIA